MVTVVAVHRAASALVVLMIALSLLARTDPEMLTLLAVICADPALLAMALVMMALSMPDASTQRRS